MFILVKESFYPLDRDDSYILLGLNDNTSSGWRSREELCFDYWTFSNLDSWPDLRYGKGYLQPQIEYLKKTYEIVDFYERTENKFVKTDKGIEYLL